MQSTSENPGSISSDPTLAETLGAAVRPADYSGLVRVERTHYVIGNEIARGGMGRILRARDRRLGRPVAIKEMLASASPGARARFEREVRITARLQHPSIVNVLEAGEWPDADPFYVMKLVSGESLDRAIARAETLEQRLALLPHVIAVVDALAYAHAQGVIHRDLKPGNVLVGEFGETVVIDWGLAKELTGAAPDGDDDAPPGASASTSGGETVAGSVVGTPAYMPPEQAEGEPADRRSDVYALGAILYQTVSGEAPFKGKSAEEVLAQVVSGDGPSVARTVPSLPPDLAAIIDKAMAFSPGDRYPSAKELAIDLKKFQTGQLVGAHRYSGWQLLRRWLQRNRTAVVVGAIATALLLVFGITALRGIMHERQQTERQRQVAEKNRGQAEELTSFMLGDLRTKLEPLGKLPLLEVVARKALAYYADRTDTMKPSELRRRAVALTNIGHVLSQQGACEEARVELDEAVAILERLSRANPLDPDVVHALAAARHERGELYWRQAKATEAIREYQANVDALAVPLVCGRDHEQDCRALLALALERIGFMEKGRGNLDAALAAFRRSRDVRSALDPTNAEWRLAMTMSHDAIAGVLDIRDELPAALTEYRTAAAIRTELVERAPGTLHYRFALAVSQDHIGTVLDVMGDSAAALQTFRDEVHTAEILTERDPTNAEWQELLGVAKGHVGDVLYERGDTRGALASYRESEAIHHELVRRDPSNLEAQHELATTHDNIGYLLKRTGDLSGALAEFEASKAIREARSASDPSNPQWRRDVTVSLDGIAATEVAQGNLDIALATYRKTLATAKTTAAIDPDNGDWQRDLALAHANVGDVLFAKHDAVAALAEYRAGGAVFDALIAKQPLDTDLRRERAHNHTSIGRALLAAKDAAGSFREYELSVTMLEALLAEDPDNAVWSNDLVIGQRGAGDAASAAGDRPAATRAYRAALAAVKKQLALAPASKALRAEVAELTRAIAAR